MMGGEKMLGFAEIDNRRWLGWRDIRVFFDSGLKQTLDSSICHPDKKVRQPQPRNKVSSNDQSIAVIAPVGVENTFLV